MSGIYGYVQNEYICKRSIPEVSRLALWNKAYGNCAHYEIKEKEYFLGCHLEKLHNKATCPSEMICHEDKIWTIDAVLYNRDRITELLGKDINGDIQAVSDEELLIELIEKRGMESLAEVNGDFAGAVYNKANNSVTLFRDHMGVRPLYYYVSNEFICFSTDLRGVLSVENVDVTINEEWVYRTFFNLLNFNSTSTEYKNIYCVRPAGFLTVKFTETPCKNRYPSRILHEKEFDYEVDDRQRKYWKGLDRAYIREKKYWYLGSKKIRYKTEKEYCDKMRELVEDAVKRRLDAFDGIAGSEMSGGLDSSLISILIKNMGRDGIYCSWSKDPKDLPLSENDERKTIFDICDRYSVECSFLSKIVPFPQLAAFNERYSKVLDIKSDEAPLEKYAFWPMLNTIALINSASYVADHGGKVVFTGHGGDEGISHRTGPYELIYNREIVNYIIYFCDVRECKNFRILRGIKRALAAYINSAISRRRSKLRTRNTRKYEDFCWQIIAPQLVKRGKKIKLIPFTFGYDVIKYITRYGDRNRMDCVAVYGAYCGVRYMLPYLDYRVIDYAVSIERGMYLRHKKDRYILKEAFRDILPERLLGEVDKRDPSYFNECAEPVPPERKAEAIKKRILEYKNKYHISGEKGIFSLDEILNEIDSKKVTEENVSELIKKCETVIDTLRLLVIVDKSRNG